MPDYELIERDEPADVRSVTKTDNKHKIHNPALLYLMSLRSKRSRATMRSALNQVAVNLGFQKLEVAPWETFGVAEAYLLLEKLSADDRVKPPTLRLYLSAFKGAIKHAWKAGLIERDVVHKIETIKYSGAKRINRYKVVIEKSHVKAVIEHCLSTQSNRGVRDAALVACLAGCGLRREEVAKLDMDDYDQVNEAFYILGKGNKERIAHLPEFVKKHLKGWLAIRGSCEGPIFKRISKHGTIVSGDGRMTGQTVYNIVRGRFESSIDTKTHPHAIRHYFGTTLLRQGVDIVTVRDMLGHVSISTTQGYIAEDESVKKSALVHVEV